MGKGLKFHQHPVAIPIVTFVVLFLFTGAAVLFVKAQAVWANNARVVKLSIDGKQQTIPTKADTVGDMLSHLNVELKKEDVVEPARDAPITSDDFRVNIYRAHPVTIEDSNGTKTATMTAHQEPREMASEAGMTVYPEDKVEVARPDEALKENIIGQKVVIDRATPASVNLYGKQIEIRAQAATVGDALAEKNIKPVHNDVVTPAPDTPLTPDMQIFVTQVGKQVDNREEIIARPVQIVEDPNLNVGTTVVRQDGSDGKKIVTYEVELRNGQEASRKVLQEVTATPPVAQIVAKGTKVIYSNPSSNVALGQQIANEMGYGDQFSCIYSVFDKESKWSTTAHNASGAYGIPQALPGSKMGPGWESDPAVQIRWGINYMVRSYGSPCGAWAFWQVNHWY